MSFARGVWRLLVGIKDALALLFLLLFFGVLFAALTARPNPGVVRDGALLLKIDGTIVEEASGVDPIAALLAQSLPTREYAARDLVRAIDAAASDDRIKAIALDLGTFLGGPQVSTREVADALGRFGTAGKPIFAHGVAYTDDSLMLASHADEIWIDPLGGAVIRGPGGTILFYGDALERFNINAHVYQMGDFKGAGEPYANAAMSPEFRDDIDRYLGNLWEEYRAHVTQARAQIDFAAATTGLVELIEANNGDLAAAAVAAGLADRIGTREEWGARIAEEVGQDEWSERPGAFAHTEFDAWLAETGEDSGGALGGGDRRIGVITVAGEINDSTAGPGTAGAARISRLLDDALEDDLAALVVRIDSPGGTVTGSETIRRAVLRHKDKGIPIVISMANYAASGGYWIATAGDHIFAEPETVTGSIGVILVVPTFENLLAEYGVNPEAVGTTALSGQPDVLGGFSDTTESLLQLETGAIYNRFVGLVAESRGVSLERVDELAQGRTWTGGTARQIGLVDQFGDLDAALAYAAQQAGIEDGDWRPRFLAGESDRFADALAGMIGAKAGPVQPLASVSSQLAAREQQRLGQLLADLQRMIASPGMQARCLACLPEASGTASPADTAGTAGTSLRALIAHWLAN